MGMDRDKTPVRRFRADDENMGEEGQGEHHRQTQDPVEEEEDEAAQQRSRMLFQTSRTVSFNSILHRTKRWTIRSHRRCTDLFCLFVLVFFTWMLYASYEWSADGRIERLTHGFDYRGRLCGLDSQENASYLLWCKPKGKASINWADPICVQSCPTAETKRAVMCPSPKVHREHEVLTNGTLSIVQTVSQDVVPSETFPTKAWLTYCIPDVAVNDELNVMTEMLQGSGFGERLTQVAERLLELVERWRLIVVAASFAVIFAYTYLLLLRSMARPLVYGSFLVILISSGLCMVCCFQRSRPIVLTTATFVRALRPVQWLEESVTPSFEYVSDFMRAAEVISEMANSTKPVFDALKTEFKATNKVVKEAVADAISSVSPFIAASPWLDKVNKMRNFSLEGMVQPLAGVYTLHALFCLGVCSAILCFLLGTMLLHSKKSVKLAIGCVEEACSVVFCIKTLLLLPFFQFVTWCAVTAVSVAITLQVLSTMQVVSDSFTIAGVEVTGIGRTLNPSTQHAAHIAMWLFGLFWVQELVAVLCHFAASYATVQWFFAPFDGMSKRVAHFLVPKGFIIAVVFHLGSLALIAFVSAFVRVIRWVWYFAMKRKEKRGRLFSCLANSVDCCLLFCESFVQYLSSHILTEIALNGNRSFCASARNVTSVLASNAGNAAMLHGTEWLFTIVGTLSISAATAAAMVGAIQNHDVINVEFLRDLEGADANLFAVVGALLGGWIGYAFMTLLDRVAETLMYCYLSHKDDTARVCNTPKSLVSLVSLHEIPN